MSRRHTSIIEIAEPIIRAIKKHPDVRKISPGIITSIRTSLPRLKCEETQGGLSLKIRAPRQVQQFYIYTNNPSSVEKVILSNWNYHITD